MKEEGLSVGAVIMEEWRSMVRDKRLLAILFLTPLLYTLMFGYLYSNDRVDQLPTVILDQDNSSLSRQMVQAFQQTEAFAVTSQVYRETEVERMLASGQAKVGIIIPADFEVGLKRGERPAVLTMIDGSNMVVSNVATRGANEVVSTFGLGATVERMQQEGLRTEEIQSAFQPIPFSYRVLYNPTYNYGVFLIFGLIGTVIQQVLFLGISLTVTREKEQGTWQRFAAWRASPWKTAYAKSAPYFLIGLVNTFFTLGIGVLLFDLPFRGTVLPLLLLAAAFIFALLGIGYAASLFSSNQVGATQVTMLIAVPSFLLSGYTWPAEAMPAALAFVSKLLPLTHFLEGVREIFLKGNGLELVLPPAITLLLMGLVTFFLAILVSGTHFFWREKGVAGELPEAGSTKYVS
ncbi:ABC transporter permease [Halalkalibacter oceani]|uniref:ABC transporter permease n=1 Tax=Halalkalibacter oceani TaxID=1653776 RepID=UPI00339A4C55